MFEIPEIYRVEKPLHVKTFLKKELKSKEKKRLQNSLLSVVLNDQIAGETIPSFLSEQYNVQVIMTLTARLSEMGEAGFIASLLQNAIKPLCILRLTDGTASRYSFALKRLSQQNTDGIVMENSFLSPVVSDTVLHDDLAFSRIKNIVNKLTFYNEWKTRAFMTFQPHLYSGIPDLLQAKFWYNERQTQDVLELLSGLKKLKEAAPRAVQAKERTKINSEISSIIKKLEKFIIHERHE